MKCKQTHNHAGAGGSAKGVCAHVAYWLGLASMTVLHYPQHVRFLSCGASSG